MKTCASSAISVVRQRKPGQAVEAKYSPDAATSPAGAAPRIAPSLVWEGPSYPHIAAGTYTAVAVRAKGPEWCKRYQRWSLLIEFELLAEPVRLAAFFNMGNNPQRCEVKRHSNFFKAWAVANGALPEKHQQMTPDVFFDGQVFIVEVADTGDDPKNRPKTDAERYSRVKEVISVEYARPQSFSPSVS
jgi:hypothetical protein